MAIVAGGAGVVAVLTFRPASSSPESVPVLSPLPPAEIKPLESVPSPVVSEPMATASAVVSPSPSASETPREADLRLIEEATVTYAAVSLPKLAPYLIHADSELRLAAREGMLQMGLAEAAPLLREAAGKIRDPREAVLLLDDADFLELPFLPVTGGPRRVQRSGQDAARAAAAEERRRRPATPPASTK